MPMFRITINQYVKETARVTVEADSHDNAREKVDRMWSNGEIDDWETGDIDAYHSPDIDKIEQLSNALDDCVEEIVVIARGFGAVGYSHFLDAMMWSSVRNRFDDKTFTNALYPAWKRLQSEKGKAHG